MERAWSDGGCPGKSLLHLGRQASDPWGRLGSRRGDRTPQQTFPWEEERRLPSPPSAGSISSRDLADISPTPNQRCQTLAAWEPASEGLGKTAQPRWSTAPGKGYGPPAWWEQRRDGGQAVPELVKPRGGLEGSPHRGKPSPATSLCPEMGRGTGNYTPPSPPQLQPPTFSAEGRCSSPASRGMPISSTLIMSVV